MAVEDERVRCLLSLRKLDASSHMRHTAPTLSLSQLSTIGVFSHDVVPLTFTSVSSVNPFNVIEAQA